MPSGIRITVALIVVASVAIGLYYASLGTSGPPAVPEEVVRLDTPAPMLIPVFIPEPVPEPEPEPLVEPELVVEPEPVIEPEPVVEPEPLVEDVVVVAKSLGIPRRGASVHLLADPFMSELDGSDVIARFEEGASTDGPAGTTWVRLTDWIERPDTEPSPWVIGERNGVQWVLVRDDAEGMVDLRRHIVAAHDRIDTALDQLLVIFVVDDETAPKFEELTYPNIGQDYALVIDRRVVAEAIIRTAVATRATFRLDCNRSFGQLIAARLRGDVAEWPADAVADASVLTPGKPIQEISPAEFQTWVIGENDTFTSVAEAWFGDRAKWTLIAHANPLVDPDRLQLGQEIMLPPKNAVLAVEVESDSHTVASGETLSDIAYAYYGAAKHWKAIYDANKAVIGNDPADLDVGMVLSMPTISGVSTTPPS